MAGKLKKEKGYTMVGTLLKSVREYKKPSLITPFFMTLEALCECLIPFMMARLIGAIDVDGISSDVAMRAIFKYGGLLLLFALLSMTSGVLAGKFAATASCGFAKNLRHDLFYKVQKFSFANVDKFSTSSLVTRLTTDVTNVQQSYQMCLRIVIRVPLQFLFAIIMSFTINPKLAWIFLAMTPVLGLVLVAIMRFVMPFFRRIFKKYDALNNSVQENVGGIRVVKAFVREDYETQKFQRASGEVRDDFTRAEKVLAFNTPVMTFFMNFVSILISVFAAYAIVDHTHWAYFDGFGMTLPPPAKLSGMRPLAILGDSVTTDHISPAGAFSPETPAGKYLTERGIPREKFNTYGSRRGTDRIMVRGTFANVRIKNKMADGKEGGFTKLQPAGTLTTIFEASEAYKKAGTPLIVFAGVDYGMGSSRDWAAKGAALLGVRAVVAQSFERIHRSNLIGMGVLPLEFTNGESAESLGLDGMETFDIEGLENPVKPKQNVTLVIRRANGEVAKTTLLCRIDTLAESHYLANGGILQYVLRKILG